jgi:hypothetical protein
MQLDDFDMIAEQPAEPPAVPPKVPPSLGLEFNCAIAAIANSQKVGQESTSCAQDSKWEGF